VTSKACLCITQPQMWGHSEPHAQQYYKLRWVSVLHMHVFVFCLVTRLLAGSFGNVFPQGCCPIVLPAVQQGEPGTSVYPPVPATDMRTTLVGDNIFHMYTVSIIILHSTCMTFMGTTTDLQTCAKPYLMCPSLDLQHMPSMNVCMHALSCRQHTRPHQKAWDTRGKVLFGHRHTGPPVRAAVSYCCSLSQLLW
jgi:hypothetical protein